MNTVIFESCIPVVAIGLFALVHASFQLGISVLTLLSGHSLGRKHALRRTLLLNMGYIAGTVIMTGLLLMGLMYLWQFLYMWPLETVMVLLAIACAVVGSLIFVAYFRRGHGTMLWIPRVFSDYLRDRAKRTKNSLESVVLGAVTVIAELPFTFVVMLCVSYIVQLFASSYDQLSIIALYSLVTSVPLMIVTVLLSGGHRLSQIQRWREANKVFLQCASGVGLCIAAIFMIVFYVGAGS